MFSAVTGPYLALLLGWLVPLGILAAYDYWE